MKRLLRWLIRPFWMLGTQFVLLWNHTPAGRKLIDTKYTLTSKRLPEAYNGLTIVQLTDLHGRCFKDHQMEIVSYVESLEPDIVLLTGDMFDHSHKRERREPITFLMKELSDRWPVYAVLGNHEVRDQTVEDIVIEMQESGVCLLRNQAEILTREGARIGIAGVDTDPMRQLYTDETEEERKAKLDETLRRYQEESVEYIILLAHKPELFEEYAETDVDLVFSGHAHGGLLEIPGSGGKRLLAPGQGFLPKYTQGLYTGNHTTMVLSSGMGGPRLGLAPEIVQVKLFRDTVNE